MFRRTANPRIMPRKPLVFFIEGLFRAAITKTQKVFKYGVRCQAPYSSLLLYSTSCNNHKNSPPPDSSCRKIKKSVLCFSCACGKCVPFRFHFVPASCSFLTAKPYTALLLHYKHTPQLRTASVVSFLFHSASSINSVSHYPSHFQRISIGVFLFSATSLPQNNLIFPTTH